MDKRLKDHFHWPLFWILISLCCVGLINLYSASYVLASGSTSSLFYSQLMWFLVGAFLFSVLIWIDYRVFIRLAYPIYILSIILLVAVIFFGKEVAGNKNWLQIGPLTLQPAELAKVAFIMVFARYLSDYPPSNKSYSFKELIVPGILVFVPFFLILLGKDIGSSLFMLLTFTTLITFTGVQKKIIIIGVILALVGGGIAYKTFLSDRQKSRISAFVDPDADPKGKGYHLIQSKIAVGSGQVWGKGYLKGMHNKLQYLPEKHTDFIFPVLAEEWGFLGSVVVLSLYLSLIIIGIQLASKAKERFGVFLALGVTALFFWQIAINLGGVLGLMPLTGVTLPLLSYGGSSLVTILIGVSFLMNISMRRFMF